MFWKLSPYQLHHLICIFLMTDDIEYFFHMLIGHLCIFFREMYIQSLCSF